MLLVALLGLGILACGVLGCSGSKGPPSPEAGNEAPEQAANQVLGEVASVHPDEGFVLIRRYGAGRLPEDAVFNTSGTGGRTASIRPTGERSGRFYAADITDGEPQKGDVVLARRLPRETLEKTTPTPERREPGFLPP